MATEALGYNGIYLERGGVDVRAMVEELLRPPERPLTPEEREDVRTFANQEIHEMPVDIGNGSEKTLDKV